MSKTCNKCKKEEGRIKFKSPNRKRCIDCNNKQYILNRKLKQETKSVLDEAKDLKLYAEYDRTKVSTDCEHKPHYWILTAIIKMIEYDSQEGSYKSCTNTEEDRKYWHDVYDDLHSAVEWVVDNYPWANPSGLLSAILYDIKTFIPYRLYTTIKNHFENYTFMTIQTRNGSRHWSIQIHAPNFI